MAIGDTVIIKGKSYKVIANVKKPSSVMTAQQSQFRQQLKNYLTEKQQDAQASFKAPVVSQDQIQQVVDMTKLTSKGQAVIPQKNYTQLTPQQRISYGIAKKGLKYQSNLSPGKTLEFRGYSKDGIPKIVKYETSVKEKIKADYRPSDTVTEKTAKFVMTGQQRMANTVNELYKKIGIATPENPSYSDLINKGKKGFIPATGRIIGFFLKKTAQLPGAIGQIPFMIGGNVAVAATNAVENSFKKILPTPKNVIYQDKGKYILEINKKTGSTNKIPKTSNVMLGAAKETVPTILKMYDPRRPEGQFNIILTLTTAGIMGKEKAIQIKMNKAINNAKITKAKVTVKPLKGNKVQVTKTGTLRISKSNLPKSLQKITPGENMNIPFKEVVTVSKKAFSSGKYNARTITSYKIPQKSILGKIKIKQKVVKGKIIGKTRTKTGIKKSAKVQKAFKEAKGTKPIKTPRQKATITETAKFKVGKLKGTMKTVTKGKRVDVISKFKQGTLKNTAKIRKILTPKAKKQYLSNMKKLIDFKDPSTTFNLRLGQKFIPKKTMINRLTNIYKQGLKNLKKTSGVTKGILRNNLKKIGSAIKSYKTRKLSVVKDKGLQSILRKYEKSPKISSCKGACDEAAQLIARYLKRKGVKTKDMKVLEIKTIGNDGKSSNHIVLKAKGKYYDPTGTQYNFNIDRSSSVLTKLPKEYVVKSVKSPSYLLEGFSKGLRKGKVTPSIASKQALTSFLKSKKGQLAIDRNPFGKFIERSNDLFEFGSKVGDDVAKITQPKITTYFRQAVKPLKTQIKIPGGISSLNNIILGARVLVNPSLIVVPPILPNLAKTNASALLQSKDKVGLLNKILEEAGVVEGVEPVTDVIPVTEPTPKSEPVTQPSTITVPGVSYRTEVNNPVYNTFFQTVPFIPNLLVPAIAAIPPIIGGGGGGTSPTQKYPSWVMRIAKNYRYQADLASRVQGIRAKSKSEVEKLLRVGRVFSGLERRKLV